MNEKLLQKIEDLQNKIADLSIDIYELKREVIMEFHGDEDELYADELEDMEIAWDLAGDEE